MASQAGEQPTVEQSSTFSAKTKDGKTIEFETLVKIFIKPPLDESWDVEYKGSKQPKGKPQSVIDGTGSKPNVDDTALGKTESSSPYVETDKTPTSDDNNMSGEGNVPPSSINVPGVDMRTQLDDYSSTSSDDDRPITSFVPDPCEAIDSLESSVKNLFSKMFGTQEPAKTPPTQEEHLNVTVQ